MPAMVEEPCPARRDPLLRGTRLVLTIIKVLAIGATILSLAAIPATWIFRHEIVARGAEASTGFLVGASVLLLGLSAITACAVLFLRHLIAIIDSVAAGSPFIPANGLRLRRMAWLALAVQGIALLAAPLGAWIEHVYPRARFEVHLDFAGILTALLLFILARVFDIGTRLAEDVEGTV